MKKRLFMFLMAVLMIFGCTACNSSKVEGKQDTGYVVTSNGGMTVQYGNYLYFVNGFRSTEDANGKNNVSGKVVQGGIYRAEIKGTEVKASDSKYNAKEFLPDAAEDIIFKYTSGVKNPYYWFNSQGYALNDSDEIIEEDTEEQPFEIDVIDVVQIVSKSVTCDSEGKGGLYIFGDYIYYASRNNEQNKSGVVQSHLYDFYRTKLDGTGTQKIYTTRSGDNVKYRFYMYKGSVYLVVYEGTDIVSVKMGKKPGDSKKIAEDVTGAILPEISTYYPDMNKDSVGNYVNNVYDYIYFTRAATKEDKPLTGVIAEMMRFDGSEAALVLSNETALTLDTVRDDSLYYTETRGGNSQFIRLDFAAYITGGTVETVKKTVFPIVTDQTQIYAYRNKSANGIYNGFDSALYVANGKLMLQQDTLNAVVIVNADVTIKTVIGDYVYFTMTSDSTKLMRTQIFPASQKEVEYEEVTELALTSETFFLPDVAAGNIFFVAAQRYDWATNYTYTKRVSLSKDEKEMFIGVLEQENPNIDVHEAHEDEDHIKDLD